jgi:hypothetical protein
MRFQDAERRDITGPTSHRGEVVQLGQQQHAESGVALPAREQCRAGRRDLSSAHEGLDVVGRDLDDLVGDEPMRFAVHSLTRLPARPFREADHGLRIVIKPIRAVADAVRFLHADVRRVRVRDVVRRYAAGQPVNVDEKRHPTS